MAEAEMAEPIPQISLDTLRAELGSLELRIVDRITRELNQKADRSHVEALERDLENIKIQGSPALINVQRDLQSIRAELRDRPEQVRQHNVMREDVESLKASRWTYRGALAVVGFIEPALMAIVLHYL